MPTVAPTDSLARVSEIMEAFAVRELPVVENEALVGIVARTDIAPHVGQLEWTPVRVVMSSPVCTVKPDASIGDVVNTLLAGRFNAIPVAIGNVLAGMITRQDLLHLLLKP